jgi:5-methylcytosine-specific restriction endonuclease McrA
MNNANNAIVPQPTLQERPQTKCVYCGEPVTQYENAQVSHFRCAFNAMAEARRRQQQVAGCACCIPPVVKIQ